MADLKNISVIIVGAAFGGLSSAIELARRGCQVQVFELSKDLSRQGDVITFAPQCTRIMAKWDDVLQNMESVGARPQELTIHDSAGKVRARQAFHTEMDGFPFLQASRTRFQQEMHKYALTLGVKVTFDARVTDYFEEGDQAGIILGGEKHTADFVIAGDGVHSKARPYVLGRPAKAINSGYALYRSWFSLDTFLKDPLTKPWAEDETDLVMTWLGPDSHSIITTNTKTRMTTVFSTHRDHDDIEESWHKKGYLKDMLKVVDGWDPRVVKAVELIPEEILIDYKLLWRDPIPKWVSDKGRIVLVGDAAHPHLPTSGAGGACAIEDGATLGVLIERLGKDKIPLALQAFYALRYERTSLTQRMGWETRHKWHQTDWEYAEGDNAILHIPQPVWLEGHDAEKYTEDNLSAVLSHIEKGTPFKSTNIPENHVHEEWTAEALTGMLDTKSHKEMYRT